MYGVLVRLVNFTFSLSSAQTCKASSPAAYPHLSSVALDDLSYDMTIILNQCLSHPSLHPKNLGVIPRRKSWLLNLDVIVLSDSGNVYDALFLAARSALWDTKVPKTRSVQYQPKSNILGDQDAEMSADGSGSIFNTREVAEAADFELMDYWDEGEPLDINQEWPVCMTLNLVRTGSSIRRCSKRSPTPCNRCQQNHRQDTSWTRCPKKKHQYRSGCSCSFHFPRRERDCSQ